MTGRSPLTRGRRSVASVDPTDFRSIPAHAGETRTRSMRCSRAEVDPRSRGGDAVKAAASSSVMGRSPLTRGRLPGRRGNGLQAGSIPAHAGETLPARCARAATRVDPRSRGGDVPCYQAASAPSGRSPLTRGRRMSPVAIKRPPGSIPAHAGETHRAHRGDAQRRVDPRSRGGDDLLFAPGAAMWGRSPLTRGRRSSKRELVGPRGSIPAHAGETEQDEWAQRALQVDPRSRGGDGGLHRRLRRHGGRSPLTRGRLLPMYHLQAERGSIPAHAGETMAAK